MRSTLGVLVLSLLFALAWSVLQPATEAAAPPTAPQAQAWSTGIVHPEDVGSLGDVVYTPRVEPYYIDLATTGLYDPDLWVVILSYQSLSIESGATVKFLNHPSRAPVVIRSVGPIALDGAIDLSGERGHSHVEYPAHAEPGPGGFRGGVGRISGLSSSSDGFGPGGGWLTPQATGNQGAAGSHATKGTPQTPYGDAGPSYGGVNVFPLIGGSGATGTATWEYGGGAGGGALLIGSDVSVSFGATSSGGAIRALGGLSSYGNNGGAGGMVRIVTPLLSWGAFSRLEAFGQHLGGAGWIRIETQGPPAQGVFPSNPAAIHSDRLGEFLPTDVPTVTLASWFDPGLGQWIPVGQDPHAVIDLGDEVDVQLSAGGHYLLRFEGRDVEVGAPLEVRVTDVQGRAQIDTRHVMGEVSGSTRAQSWTDVSVDIVDGISTVQARAVLR